MSSTHPIPRKMKERNEHPQPDAKNPMLIHYKYFIYAVIGFLMICMAVVMMSASPAPAPAPAEGSEQNISLYEFRLKSGERLTEKELDHYCLLLCEARGLCGLSNCQDAVLLYRASALAHLKETMQGQFVIMSDGKQVKITGEGLRHTLKGKNLKNPKEYEKNIKFIDTTFDLKRILKTLKHKSTEPAKNCNCNAIHIYKGKLSGGYRIKVVVKENHNGDFTFYDYSLKRE